MEGVDGWLEPCGISCSDDPAIPNEPPEPVLGFERSQGSTARNQPALLISSHGLDLCRLNCRTIGTQYCGLTDSHLTALPLVTVFPQLYHDLWLHDT